MYFLVKFVGIENIDSSDVKDYVNLRNFALKHHKKSIKK